MGSIMAGGLSEVVTVFDELYGFYNNNWIDNDGKIIRVDSATIQVIPSNSLNSDSFGLAVYLTMADLSIKSIKELLGSNLSSAEILDAYAFIRENAGCSVALINSDLMW